MRPKHGCVWDYEQYIKDQMQMEKSHLKEFPCVVPSWDNSPRRKDQFWALVNNTPRLYGKWLFYILKNFVPYSEEENFVFINAWNEWAEGNYLEPDNKWGKLYLEETRRVLDANNL